uniref:Replication protein A C-terminal domain-containing protein n=1 Tax=Mycena chlorophos TaxID=658473 RepID=A0ABQ0KZA5_MYCCL|nr:predicted protein [Mycena chlorophos]
MEDEPTLTLRPVSIAQLRKAKQGLSGWALNGLALTKVLVVGEVRDHKASTVGRTFVIDDGTGSMSGKMWVETDYRELELPFRGVPLDRPTHFRMISSLGVYAEKRFLTVTHMRPVADPHEIYHHILNIIYTHVSLQKKPLTKATAEAAEVAMEVEPVKEDKKLAERVVAYLSTGRSDIGGGVSIEKMAQIFKCETDELRVSLEALSEQGEIYISRADDCVCLM